jgi:hypothetical protein
MPLVRASCGSANAARRRAARCAVLNNELLVEHILACGRLDAADLARAAQVCRLWLRLAAADAAWRMVWRREALSMRSFEASVAAPRGPGFRAAVAQIFASRLVTKEPEWRLSDFTLALDITWRGRPVFAALRTLDALDDAHGHGETSSLSFVNQLEEGEGDAPLSMRKLRNATTPERLARVLPQLQMHMMIRRSDGALACVAEHVECKEVYCVNAVTGRAAEPLFLSWYSSDQDNQPSHFFSAFDDENNAAAIDWMCELTELEDGGEVGGKFDSAELQLSLENEWGAVDADSLLHAVVHTLRWVMPHAPVAAAAALASRAAQEAAQAAVAADA